MKKLILLVVVFGLIVAYCDVASASIITGVDRTRGASGNRAPIGAYTGDTDPLPSDPGGVKDGNLIYSDRTFTFTTTPLQLIGYENVRTFNTDKAQNNILVNYWMTIGEPAKLWMAMDDRIPAEYDTEGQDEFLSQQEAVDLVVHTWAAPGLFVDTKLDLFVAGDSDRRMSVYETSEVLPAGTYHFALNPTGKNFYFMGAVPEPATIALLGLGGLGLLRRKR